MGDRQYCGSTGVPLANCGGLCTEPFLVGAKSLRIIDNAICVLNVLGINLSQRKDMFSLKPLISLTLLSLFNE